MVHLKRFSFERGWREKIDVPVQYKVNDFNLNAFLHEDSPNRNTLYELYGIIEHSGNFAGGHYTAYVKNNFDKEWYHFNDSVSRKVSEKDIYDIKDAYILFYQQKETK